MTKGKITRIKWDKNMGMADWEAKRHEIEGIGGEHVRFGASDISVITGSNSFKCPARLFHHATGFHHSFFITERTLAGHLAEPIIAKRWDGYVHNDEYQSLMNVRNGISVRKSRKADFFLLNSAYPNMFASIDYLPSGQVFSPFTGEKYKPLTPYEFKNTNQFYYKMWPNGIAQQYKEQIHAQMMVGNTEVGVLLTYIDGYKFVPLEVEREPELVQFIDYKVREFAEKVAIGKMYLNLAKETDDEVERGELMFMYEQIAPDPVGMDDNLELLDEMYEDGNGLEKLGDDQDAHHMLQYLKCTKVSNNIDAYKKELRAKIVLSCGEFEGLKTDHAVCINRRATKEKKSHFSVKPVVQK